MKLVAWNFQSLTVPMIEFEGKLYCTSKGIYTALGVNQKQFRMCLIRNKERIGDPLGSQNVTLRNFIRENKEFFDVIRVKDDIQLWSAKQMFIFSIKLTSPVADQYQDELWDLVERHAQTSYVTVEQYQELEGKLEFLFHNMQVLLQREEAAKTPMNTIASYAGKMLRMQSSTKPFRTDKVIKAN